MPDEKRQKTPIKIDVSMNWPTGFQSPEVEALAARPVAGDITCLCGSDAGSGTQGCRCASKAGSGSAFAEL